MEALEAYLFFLWNTFQYDWSIFSTPWVYYSVIPFFLYFIIFLIKWYILLIPITMPCSIIARGGLFVWPVKQKKEKILD